MQLKPEPFDISYAEAFKSQQVVQVYRYRPPYPAEAFDILVSLLKDEPYTVLDVGAGDGDIARSLVERVERVDAVDCSVQMIAQGKQLPRGNHPRLNWIEGKVEEVPLKPPYALITAGSSIHWTEWPLAFPRFRELLTPAGLLALVYRRTLPMPWSADLRKLREQFAARQNHHPIDVVQELEQRQWFDKQGQQETAPVPFVQTVEDFIAGLHSRSGFTRERLGEQKATDFDQQVRHLLLSFHHDGLLPLQAIGIVSWGKPTTGEAP